MALGFFVVCSHSCRGRFCVTLIQGKSRHSSTWLGGKTYGGCLPNVSQMPPRCLPDASQMSPRCLPDAAQMPLRCLPDASRCFPDASRCFQKKLFGVSRWGNFLMGASGKLLTKNGENYGGGKIENVDLHPIPPYTPGPGSRALGYREGWGASPHFKFSPLRSFPYF